MPAGYPVKVNYLTGDVLTAADLNDLAGTVNLYDPTAKGDLFPASAADTVSRLAVGANDTVLTADSAAATGMKWAAAAAVGANWSLLNAGGTALSGAGSSLTISGISGAEQIMVLISNASTTSGNVCRIRINSNSGSIYTNYGNAFQAQSTYSASLTYGFDEPAIAQIELASMSSDATSAVDAAITFSGCNSAGLKQFIFSAAGNIGSSGVNNTSRNGQGFVNTTAVVTAINVVTSGTFDAGIVYVYTTA